MKQTVTQSYASAVWTRCPYCGFKNVTKLDEMVQWPTTHLVTCDCEEGGCDKKYAITVTWYSKIEVASLQAEYYHEGPFAESKLFAEDGFTVTK
jgi:hypothetical protein